MTHNFDTPQKETAVNAGNIAAVEQNAQINITRAEEISQVDSSNASIEPKDVANQINDEQFVAEISQLPYLQYQQQRVANAKRLRINANALDQLVRAAQRSRSIEEKGNELALPVIEPWPDAVNPVELLDEFTEVLEKHTVLPPESIHAIALWCVYSYSHDCFDISPRLLLTSPEKRCGKTTTLGVIAQLANRALATSNITPASIFRIIEEAKPTLLIDEADTFLGKSEDMRGIINSGHGRTGASIIRTVGDEHKPRRFSTWAPMLIALIGLPPETILDRSIAIPLLRKKKDEEIERLNPLNVKFDELRSKALRWSMDNAESLRTSSHEACDWLNDRAADNWRPLLAIANAVGGDWPKRALAASQKLATSQVADDASTGAMLLADIREIFAETGQIGVASQDICNELAKLDHRPWSAWKYDKAAITPRQISEILRPFGIRSKNIRLSTGQFKGYAPEDFTDAFERYLD